MHISDDAGMSPYNYAFNYPVMFNDPSGMEGEETTKGIWYSIKDKNTGHVDKNGMPI